MLWVFWSTVTRWLETAAVRPRATATLPIPSTSGTPAATTAPNAMSRITRVTGRLTNSARWKSLPNVASNSRVIDPGPICPTCRSGRAAPRRVVTASDGATTSSGCGRVVSVAERAAASSRGMTTLRPSAPGIGSPTRATPSTPWYAAASSAPSAAACSGAREPVRTVAMIRSVGRSPKSAWEMRVWARADSPTRLCSCGVVTMPVDSSMTDPTSPRVARASTHHRWVTHQAATDDRGTPAGGSTRGLVCPCGDGGIPVGSAAAESGIADEETCVVMTSRLSSVPIRHDPV
ncbi:MAG: hypothetical protein BWY91_03033 [bacterium ADurb.BinA028]|nr:MAG: hypothetical protein BWY91_03033 [bacterium ADurb.BinA028]